MCDKTDGPETLPKCLAVDGNATLNAGVGSHNLHLYMRRVNREENTLKEISMHLSLEEVEGLIRGLKHKLKLCYEAKVEKL